MINNRETLAAPQAVAVLGVVEAAHIDQLLEAAIGMIAQHLHRLRQVRGTHDDGQLAEAVDGFDARIAQGVFKTQ